MKVKGSQAIIKVLLEQRRGYSLWLSRGTGNPLK